MKRVWVLTLFPDYFLPFQNLGVIGQALSKDRIDKSIATILVDIRAFSPDKHKNVDDTPFGGGPGMVMRADVLKEALLQGVVKKGGYGDQYKEKLHVVYTSPRGELWNQDLAQNFATKFLSGSDGTQKDLVFVCGRYEGVDERFLNNYVNQHLSIGDYVLTGGEIAVMAILDSMIRLHPLVLGNSFSAVDESFGNSLLEFPQFTKPRDFEGESVPEVLLSGHHANINKYRQKEREEITKRLRPDLFLKHKRESKK